jgi:glycosyltransferase involved in cell wall biosynthesis
MTRPTLFVVSGYPSRSETFVYREVRGLKRAGVPVQVASLHETGETVQDADGVVDPPDFHLYGARSGRSLLGSLAELLRHPLRAARTLGTAFADAAWPGEPVPLSTRAKLIPQAFFALALARWARGRGVRHLHCHFAHAPTTIGMYAALQLGASFSFVGHANDLFQRRALLRRKLQRSAFVSCISEWHRELYRGVEPAGAGRYRVIRCGVDMATWTGGENGASHGEGRALITVARLVEKKGIDTLIEAVSKLGQLDDRPWTLQIVGDGPLRGPWEALAARLGCSDRVRWLGAQDNEQVRRLMEGAGQFVLPCRTDASGDRDGIPVVLMEAMASRLPVVVGDLPAIRELVQDGVTGRLVEPDRGEALARVLQELARDEDLRGKLARAGRLRVEEEFSLEANVARLKRAIEEVA